MSKKVKLYLLVVINFIIWGYIGYKVYVALQGDDSIAFNESSAPIQKINAITQKDSISLILNYPDPFLKGFQSEKLPVSNSSNNNINNAITQKKPVVVKTPTVVVTPTVDIKYLGFIQNTEKGTQTALVSINGKSTFASKGQTIEGILFKEISANELSVIIDKKKAIIKK